MSIAQRPWPAAPVDPRSNRVPDPSPPRPAGPKLGAFRR